MKKTMVLLTRPVSRAPKNLAFAVLQQADHIALISDGVYNRPADIHPDGLYGMPGGHRAVGGGPQDTGSWPDNWSALENDVSSRGLEVGCKLIDYPGLVEEILRHEKVITI